SIRQCTLFSSSTRLDTSSQSQATSSPHGERICAARHLAPRLSSTNQPSPRLFLCRAATSGPPARGSHPRLRPSRILFCLGPCFLIEGGGELRCEFCRSCSPAGPCKSFSRREHWLTGRRLLPR